MIALAAQAGGGVRPAACIAQTSAGASWRLAGVRLGGAAAVLAGGGLAAGLLRRRRSCQPGRIEHLEVRHLDAGLKVHLLACGRRRVLVARSREGVCVLDRWAEPPASRFPAVVAPGGGHESGAGQEPA